MERSLANGFGDNPETSGSGSWMIGSYVGTNTLGTKRVLLGKIVSIDEMSKLYRVIYEDGHQEDLDHELVSRILILEEGVSKLTPRKKKLDRIIPLVGLNRRTTRSRKGISVSVGRVSSEGLSKDADSSSDSCDHARVPGTLVLPLELPMSSGDIAVPEGSVSLLFSSYNFLRSFSLQLFLSPFGFDDYVGSLNCTAQNSLMDSIHLSLMRALSRHLQLLSLEGPNLASKCLKLYDWALLDMLTWPAFLVEYLYVMGYVAELDSKEFIDCVLYGEYYCLSVATKLKVLQLLCDDVVNSGELRAELGMRVGEEEDDEEGLDASFSLEEVPTSVHGRSWEKSGWKDSVVLGESLVLENQHVSTVGSEQGADGSANSQDKNSDECCLCGMDGTLICCDGCPSAYHSRCIGLSKAFLPEGLWFCPECSINKLGLTSSRIGKGARGAEVFGTDLYGRMFVGTCNYLLVLGTSFNEDSISRYYNEHDIPKVLSVISSTQANAVAYVDISIGISEYFEIPINFLNVERVDSMRDTLANKDDDVHYFANTPPWTINILDNSGDNSVSNIMASKLKHSVANDDGTEDPVSPSVMGQVISGAQINIMHSLDVCINKIPATPDEVLVPLNNENPTNGIVVCTDTKVSLSKQIETREKPGFGSVVTDLSYSNPAMPTKKSILLSKIAFSSGNGSDICKEDVDSSPFSTKNGSAGACYESKRLFNVCDVTRKSTHNRASTVPVSFKPLSYINQYIQGDIAASAAASLAVLLTKDSKIAVLQCSSNQRKIVSATIALQMKAFSLAVMNYLWPYAEKKLMDVPRERCGWCIACKGPTTNKKGCLLNLAASNAIKGPVRNGNLRASKHHESHLPVIAAQLLIMEESLRGLMVGPFLDESNNEWRRQVREASDCSFLKLLILQLEENIRGIAFSGGWTKIIDDLTENSKSSNVFCRIGGNKKRGRSKRQSEPTIASSDDKCDYLQWWRGGKLSKAIVQTATIPSSLVKKAARQGGRRRIIGISYHECSAYRRRSRQVAWRAAVDLSKSTSQLALQVRYLDAHIRWKEFSRPEQISIDVKGSETDVTIFRNASISDKKFWEDKILYALKFGDQKHLPSRITKTVLESETAQDGSEKLWFSEVHLPVYLIKEYEEKVGTCQILPAMSTVHNMAKFYRRGLKLYWGDVFTYLTCKKENPVKCSSCQKDVFLRYALRCKACEDYCHLDCSVASVAKHEDDPMFSRMCKLCYSVKCPTLIESSERTYSMKPSLLELSSPGMNGIRQSRLCSSSQSVSKMEFNSDSRSSNHPSLKSKTKRKGGAWLTHGIVWKRKKHGPEGGKEFRMENILLKVEEGSYSSKSPICCLCKMPYNSNLMYVCCGSCNNWCHADAVLLDETKVLEVVGFKCCKCRRKSSPKCPYSEIGYLKLEEQLKHDNAVEINDAMHFLPKSESPTTSMSDSETDNFGVVEFDPLLHSIDNFKPVDETTLEMEHKFDASIQSLKGQQKLSRKSQVKHEDFDEWLAAGQIGYPLHETSQSLQNIPAPNPMSASWKMPASLEWDSIELYGHDNLDFKNICKEEHLPDQELDAAGNMEFEPQTYFSFTELLSSADDMPVGLAEHQDVSIPLNDYEATYSDRPCHTFPVKNEIIVKEEYAFDGFECQKCKLYIPSPDLICEICRLCIHSHCSPWVEESIEISSGSKWRCGNCREWR